MVDLLLRSGGDETAVDIEGATAHDIVESKLAEQAPAGVVEDDGDVEHVRMLLVNAPADRAWRRRGLLVLCRTFPERVQLSQQDSSSSSSSRAHVAGAAPRTCSRAKLTKLARTEADWAGVWDMLLTGWGEEAILDDRGASVKPAGEIYNRLVLLYFLQTKWAKGPLYNGNEVAGTVVKTGLS